MDDKPSPLSSFVTAATCNQAMKSSRSYQSERLFLKYHAARINLLDLDLRLDHRVVIA